MKCLLILPGSFGIGLRRSWNVLFWNKTMGWKNFCLQLLVRCPFALCCIPSSFGEKGDCCMGGSLIQAKAIIKKKILKMQPSVFPRVLLWCMWPCFGSGFFFLCKFSFCFAHVLCWQDVVLLFYCFSPMDDTLFFTTCCIFFLSLITVIWCLHSIRTLLSVLLVFPNHHSAFIKRCLDLVI